MIAAERERDTDAPHFGSSCLGSCSMGFWGNFEIHSLRFVEVRIVCGPPIASMADLRGLRTLTIFSALWMVSCFTRDQCGVSSWLP